LKVYPNYHTTTITADATTNSDFGSTGQIHFHGYSRCKVSEIVTAELFTVQISFL